MMRFRVESRDGVRGILLAESRFLDESEFKRLELDAGAVYMVPSKRLAPRADGSYELMIERSELEQYAYPPRAEAPGPVGVADTAHHTFSRDVHPELAGLGISRTMVDHETGIDEPLSREDYEIRRVSINRVLDAPAETRYEGDSMILPVVEEVLVVEKRLLLREEIWITKKPQESRDVRTVTTRREQISIAGEVPPLSKS